MTHPLAVRPQSRRLWPTLGWLVMCGMMVLLVGGLIYYIKTRPTPPTMPPLDHTQGQHAGQGGFQRVTYSPKSTPEANGVATKIVQSLAPAPVPSQASEKPLTPPRPVSSPRKPRLVLVSSVNALPAPPEKPAGPLYTLPGWTYVAATLEPILNSEIEGFFTVVTIRPIYDSTGQHVLIPQGQRLGAKTQTAELLLGQERIPGFAISMTIKGQAIDLGDAPILDATGTLGLRDLVDNHVWRLIWTTLAIGTLNGGRQMIQTEVATGGAGAVAAGIAQQGALVSQQRLGRAQDTRPTLIVRSGQLVQILIPKPLELPDAFS